MSSNINPYNINGSFPIAGQDNDSQGFRDNFTNIRTNLAFAKGELEDLQNKVVLKSALEGGSVDNNFNGTLISNVRVKGLTEPILDQANLAGSVTIPFTDGHFHKVISNGPITFEVINWPAAGQYAQLRLQVTVTDVTHTLQFPASFSIGPSELLGCDSSTGVHVITVPSEGDYVFDLSTADGGVTAMISEHTKKLVKADSLSSVSAMSDVMVTTPATGEALVFDGVNWKNDNVDFNSLANVPAFANVSVTGSYLDLTDAPDLAAVATSGDYQDLASKPTLATVATSGNYNDLVNKPVLASVATTGDYIDLTNKPVTAGTQVDIYGDPGDYAGMMKVDANYLYVCFGTHNGSTVIWKKVALSSL